MLIQRQCQTVLLNLSALSNGLGNRSPSVNILVNLSALLVLHDLPNLLKYFVIPARPGRRGLSEDQAVTFGNSWAKCVLVRSFGPAPYSPHADFRFSLSGLIFLLLAPSGFLRIRPRGCKSPSLSCVCSVCLPSLSVRFCCPLSTLLPCLLPSSDFLALVLSPHSLSLISLSHLSLSLSPSLFSSFIA